MDISTGLGLLAGAIVVTTLIMLGGDFGMFYSEHALIVIFGGSFSATLIRFPLSSIFHGLPLGAKFAFTMRRMGLRELIDEIAGFAEIVRKQGPVGLEKVEVDDPFLAKAVRFVADLPKTRNAKILRRVIRGAYLGQADLGDLSALENPAAVETIKELKARPV